MPSRSVRALIAMSASCLILSSLTSCASTPVRVDADTYCEKARHISATDEQIAVITAPATWPIMKPYAQQIAAHNVTYDKSCLAPAKQQ